MTIKIPKTDQDLVINPWSIALICLLITCGFSDIFEGKYGSAFGLILFALMWGIIIPLLVDRAEKHCSQKG